LTTEPPALPGLYLDLLGAVEDLEREGGRTWIGEAGFRMPPVGEAAGPHWIDKLAEGRWPGMHPDLVPFASDGLGNRYCFYRSARPELKGHPAIVFWVLESNRALPIATDFGAFLDWLGLVAEWTLLRGDESVIDEEHVRGVLQPLLRQLGRGDEAAAALGEGIPTRRALLEALLRHQPRNPAALLWRAMAQLDAGDLGEVRATCAQAEAAFPELVLAPFVEAAAEERGGSPVERTAALARAIRKPLVYSGDENVPYFGDLPSLDPAWLAEELATAPLPADDVLFDPIWDLIAAYDPAAASGWLTVSVAYANAGNVATALTMAQNALLFAIPEERPAVLRYLAELYASLGASWHARTLLAEADRSARRAALRRD
jgi:hypothetical protein